jgi:hypothetical protein
VIRHLDSNEAIYSAQMPVRFLDPVTEVRVVIRVNRCIFPLAGEYLCTLQLDGEWLTQRTLRVVERQE